jgi:hypothetical protein
MDLMEINIGDWVTVSNHGNLFLRAQVKEIDFSENFAKVKWEISCTTDVVEIANLHSYSTSATSKQKRMKTDFFHHKKTKGMRPQQMMKSYVTNKQCQKV